MNIYLPTRPNQPHLWEEGQNPSPRERSGPGATPGPRTEQPLEEAPAASGNGTPRRSWMKHVLVFTCLMLFSVSTYALVSQYIITAVMVRGRSMTPTLQDGERYFLNRWLLHFREPQRGDVVVIRDKGHSDFAVKRIVALPGETITLRSGAVLIDGRRLREPYLTPGTATFAPSVGDMQMTLGEDQYFVMGDNRPYSEDSRYYGALQFKQIIGVLVR